MIETADELASILSGTALQGREVALLKVLDTDVSALVVEIPIDEIEDAWQTARALVDQTGRWPIISSFWRGSTGSLEERLKNEDPFSRFYYEEAPDATDISPQGLIEKSKTVDVEKFLRQLEVSCAEEIDDDWIEDDLESCVEVVGRRPEPGELDQSIENPSTRISRWIYEHQLSTSSLAQPNSDPFQWFRPDNAFLVLLPTSCGWEALAYCHFFGAYEGSEKYIAVGKSWEERFGAELVCHYGTMLQCVVRTPPTDPLEAWQLAREHDLIANCTLASPGVLLHEYASTLIGRSRWFLHERP